MKMKHEDAKTRRGKGNRPMRTSDATRKTTRGKAEEWGGIHAKSVSRLGDDNARIKAVRIIIYTQMDEEQGRIDYSDAARNAWRQPSEEEIKRCIAEVITKLRRHGDYNRKHRSNDTGEGDEGNEAEE